MKERIIFIAVKTGDNQFSVTPDFEAGHSSVVSHLVGCGAIDAVNMDNLGFVTNFGKFVNREDAMKIAKSAGQIKDNGQVHGPLYSFNLAIPK